MKGVVLLIVGLSASFCYGCACRPPALAARVQALEVIALKTEIGELRDLLSEVTAGESDAIPALNDVVEMLGMNWPNAEAVNGSLLKAASAGRLQAGEAAPTSKTACSVQCWEAYRDALRNCSPRDYMCKIRASDRLKCCISRCYGRPC